MLLKKTKIVCTIGPSSWDPDVLKKMIDGGMNCARVNSAFADPAELDKVAKLVRDISHDVSLMVDVKGPEVRLNKFPAPIVIKPGDEIVIGSTTEDKVYPANYPNVYEHLKPGQRMVVGDGDVELTLKEIRDGKMYCEVVFGELFRPGKALNLPGATYTSETLTTKDLENLNHCLKTEWDFVSASFIQNAEAAKKIKAIIGEQPMKLIAKIEDQQGVDNIDSILQVVDGIMIARGGLGVELGLEKVPMVQQYLLERGQAVGKIVITATQMLESMTYNPRPTRAEVNDVAIAVMSGSDCVMLSGETSAGKYPAEAVQEMTTICKEIEPHLEADIIHDKADSPTTTDALTKAAAEMCVELEGEITKVLVVSRSGTTARLLGRHGIKQPIYAFTSSDYFSRTLMLSKGIVQAFTLPPTELNREEALQMLITHAKELGIIEAGEKIVVLTKVPTGGDRYFPNLFEVVTVS